MFEEKLPRLEGLFALSRAQGLDVRPTLLRVLTDMFVEARHLSEAEVARFGELAIHLIEQVDEETRVVVAGKLGPNANAPRPVLDKLIASEPEAAERIIEASPLLTMEDLWTLAIDGGPMTCGAIARRRDLDLELTRFLARKGYPLVADALAANPAAPVDREVIASLAPSFREVPDLAARIAARRGVEPAWLAPLFLVLPGPARASVLDAYRRHASDRRPLTRETQLAAPQLVLALMENAALSRATDDLAIGLARVLGIDGGDALRIVRESSGEALALALIAVGMPSDQAARVLMFTVRQFSESAEGLRRLVELMETMPRSAATRIVRAFAPPLESDRQPRHEGVFAASSPARPKGQGQRRDGGKESDRREGLGEDG
jgi:uncharacterized protein (DUF2336 family)